MILTAMSIITCLILLVSLVETYWGLRSIIGLESVTPVETFSDKISLIIAACNEEEHIADTLYALKKQTYSNIEIICVNDRSTDNTGTIMEALSQEDPRIKVIHIQELPEGWLGKNHAMVRGVSAATGEWLLFIDADVHLEPLVLARTLNYAQEQKLDHLTAFGHYKCQGFIYNIVHLIYQGHGMLISLKPWLARSKHSKKSINLGIFCLIKRTVYNACGGHLIAPLECLEDYRLGERVKKHGYSQDVVNAQYDISIRWYPTLRQHIQGYKKNVFAYFRYRLAPVIMGVVAWYGLFVWPVVACFITSGIGQLVNMINAIILFLLYLKVAQFFKVSKFYALFYPIGLTIYPYLIISSVLHFFINKGVYWRGTFYSAATLRNSI